MKKKYWIYVLRSKINGTKYTGYTRDLEDRLHRHNLGEYPYTKKFRPWKIIYKEEVESKSEAFKKEQFYKTGAGRKVLKGLLGSPT